MTVFRGTKVKVIIELSGNVHFSYCPLLWLFCSKGENNEIYRTHRRTLRALYEDRESTIEELLDKDKSMTIHKKNLQMLMVEIYKQLTI